MQAEQNKLKDNFKLMAGSMDPEGNPDTNVASGPLGLAGLSGRCRCQAARPCLIAVACFPVAGCGVSGGGAESARSPIHGPPCLMGFSCCPLPLQKRGPLFSTAISLNCKMGSRAGALLAEAMLRWPRSHQLSPATCLRSTYPQTWLAACGVSSSSSSRSCCTRGMTPLSWR